MFKAYFFLQKKQKIRKLSILAELFVIFHTFSEKFSRETQKVIKQISKVVVVENLNKKYRKNIYIWH